MFPCQSGANKPSVNTHINRRSLYEAQERMILMGAEQLVLERIVR